MAACRPASMSSALLKAGCRELVGAGGSWREPWSTSTNDVTLMKSSVL
jgi:hypothetical protein